MLTDQFKIFPVVRGYTVMMRERGCGDEDIFPVLIALALGKAGENMGGNCGGILIEIENATNLNQLCHFFSFLLQ